MPTTVIVQAISQSAVAKESQDLQHRACGPDRPRGDRRYEGPSPLDAIEGRVDLLIDLNPRQDPILFDESAAVLTEVE